VRFKITSLRRRNDGPLENMDIESADRATLGGADESATVVGWPQLVLEPNFEVNHKNAIVHALRCPLVDERTWALNALLVMSCDTHKVLRASQIPGLVEALSSLVELSLDGADRDEKPLTEDEDEARRLDLRHAQWKALSDPAVGEARRRALWDAVGADGAVSMAVVREVLDFRREDTENEFNEGFMALHILHNLAQNDVNQAGMLSCAALCSALESCLRWPVFRGGDLSAVRIALRILLTLCVSNSFSRNYSRYGDLLIDTLRQFVLIDDPRLCLEGVGAMAYLLDSKVAMHTRSILSARIRDEILGFDLVRMLGRLCAAGDSRIVLRAVQAIHGAVYSAELGGCVELLDQLLSIPHFVDTIVGIACAPPSDRNYVGDAALRAALLLEALQGNAKGRILLAPHVGAITVLAFGPDETLGEIACGILYCFDKLDSQAREVQRKVEAKIKARKVQQESAQRELAKRQARNATPW